jgi:hypothetical protein
MGTKFDDIAVLMPSLQQDESVSLRGPVQCVASNHPTCQVTCAGGECLAFYHEPSGPCVAQCLEGAVKPIRLSDEFSLQLVARRGAPVLELFEADLPKSLIRALRDFQGEIHLEGRFTRAAFLIRLAEITSGKKAPGEGSNFA